MQELPTPLDQLHQILLSGDDTFHSVLFNCTVFLRVGNILQRTYKAHSLL
jgi:hypothetical protein